MKGQLGVKWLTIWIAIWKVTLTSLTTGAPRPKIALNSQPLRSPSSKLRSRSKRGKKRQRSRASPYQRLPTNRMIRSRRTCPMCHNPNLQLTRSSGKGVKEGSPRVLANILFNDTRFELIHKIKALADLMTLENERILRSQNWHANQRLQLLNTYHYVSYLETKSQKNG